MAQTLVTERLRLRPYKLADLDEMAVMFGDADVTAHTLLGRRTREQTLEVLQDYMSYFAAHGYGMRAITKTTGEYLGECGIFDSPTGDGRFYLRYALRREAWGAGYAPEAARAVIKEVFADLGQEWLMAGVTPSNTVSLRVMEKLGFRHIGMANVHKIDFKLFELQRDSRTYGTSPSGQAVED